MQACLYCGKDVPQLLGKRKRLYCNDVCKQLAYRKRKQYVNSRDVDDIPKNSTQKQTYATMVAELTTLRTVVEHQSQTIEFHKETTLEKLTEVDRLRRILTNQAIDLKQLELLREKITRVEQEKAEIEQENTHLKHLLDVERRYLEDTKPRAFKAWLRKQPSSPWRVKFLSDQLVPARGSRSLYEAHVRRLCTDEEERDDFVRLWKLMLMQS